MFKRLSAAFAAVIIAIAAMTVTVFAAGSCSLRQTSSAPAGETFTVDVVLSENPGISVLSCNIRYNYEDVQFVSVSDAGLLKGFYYTNIGNAVQLTWSGDGNDITDNGTFATITFKCIRENNGGSTLSNTVTAYSHGMLPTTINGNTTVLLFGANNQFDTPNPDGNGENPNPEEQGEVIEETEVVPDETEPPETTAEPTTTEPPETEPPTTTTRRTRTPRTDPPETTPEPTTTPPTTTPEPTTTEPTTTWEPTTTPPTTTEVTTPTTELTTETEPAFSDVYAEEVNNKAANRGTILIAVIAIALTAVCVIGIEYYKRNR